MLGLPSHEPGCRPAARPAPRPAPWFARLSGLLASCAAALAQDPAGTPASALARDVPSEFRFDGATVRRETELDVDFAGELWVWAKSTDLRPRLSVASARAQGTPVPDTGHPMAVVLVAAPGDRVRIAVSVEAGASGTVRLLARGVVESAESTRDAAAIGGELDALGPSTDRAEAAAQATLLAERALAGGERQPGSFALAQVMRRIAPYLEAAGRIEVARRLHAYVVATYAASMPATAQQLIESRWALGSRSYYLRDALAAREQFTEVVRVLTAVRTPADAQLLNARGALASIEKALGHPEAARALEEQVLETAVATRDDDDPLLQRARLNLANSNYLLGDHERAAALYRDILAARSQRLGNDNPEVQKAFDGLAGAYQSLGDWARAKQVIEEALAALGGGREAGGGSFFESVERRKSLTALRRNLAYVSRQLGDFRSSLELLEREIAALDERLAATDEQRLTLREDYAITIFELGEHDHAIEILRDVCDLRAVATPGDALQDRRQNLATLLTRAGRLPEARLVAESVLQARLSAHPEASRLVQLARQGLAGVMFEQGDLDAARSLYETILATMSRTDGVSRTELQQAREGLGLVLYRAGDLEEAHRIVAPAAAELAGLWPEAHPARVQIEQLLAGILVARGEPDRARQLLERQLRVLSGARSPDHASLRSARAALAEAESRSGHLARAEELMAQVRASVDRATPADDPDRSLTVSIQLALRHRAAGPEAALPLARELTELVARGLRAAACARSSRETEAVIARYDDAISTLLAIGLTAEANAGPFLEMALSLIEAGRACGAATARVRRLLAADPELRSRAAELQRDWLAASARLARLADGEQGEEFVDVLREVDRAEQAIRGMLADGAGELPVLAEQLAALSAGSAWITFRAFRPSDAGSRRAEERLAALVARSDGAVRGFDLGPVAAVREKIAAWRRALGVRDGLTRGTAPGRDPEARVPAEPAAARRGAELRAAVWDPLTPALAAADSVLLSPADELHLVPFDALPLADGRVLGDTVRCRLRGSHDDVDRVRHAGVRTRILSGVDFGTGDGPRFAGRTAIGPFAALPGSRREGVEVAALASSDEHAIVELFEGPAATRAALTGDSASVRFLHIATHGFFDPEIAREAPPAEPLDALLALGRAQTLGERVRGMSPMVACGLALAGANRAADGIVTAQEIATLDLSGCELVVISTCEGSAGFAASGRGVASMQRAFALAGARACAASLWPVEDAATRRLMVEFYRLLWQERLPPDRALWQAKQVLRRAGAPTWHWAGWVL